MFGVWPHAGKTTSPAWGISARIIIDGSTHGASWSPTAMRVGTESARSFDSRSWTVGRLDITSRARCAQAWASLSIFAVAIMLSLPRSVGRARRTTIAHGASRLSWRLRVSTSEGGDDRAENSEPCSYFETMGLTDEVGASKRVGGRRADGSHERAEGLGRSQAFGEDLRRDGGPDGLSEVAGRREKTVGHAQLLGRYAGQHGCIVRILEQASSEALHEQRPDHVHVGCAATKQAHQEHGDADAEHAGRGE